MSWLEEAAAQNRNPTAISTNEGWDGGIIK